MEANQVNPLPFSALEKKILANRIEIEAWFRSAWKNFRPLLFSSVDLRNSGYKIAAVDTNVFPAGFNNLNPDFYPLCIQAAQSTLSEQYPNCKNILIIPESHTRNQHYFENVFILQDIFQKSGFNVKVGSLLLQEKTKEISISKYQKLTLESIEKINNKLISNDFTPCFIVLNNDLSEGIPPLLLNLEQPIDPPPHIRLVNTE